MKTQFWNETNKISKRHVIIIGADIATCQLEAQPITDCAVL